MEHLLSIIGQFIVNFINSMGYYGVAFLMAIESANIPLPSEVIMTFAGYLAFQGHMSIYWAAFAGAIGCVIGSIFSWGIGVWGGRPLLNRYGKYILISHHDLDKADSWFKKHGDATVFFGRLIPIIRTYISLPAGIAKMKLPKFIIYTFVGSYPWCLFLAWVGKKLGQNWQNVRQYFHGLDYIIAGLLLLGIAYWIYRHIRNNSKLKNNIS
jgi:membrane protein DedA with SNARE-associated domain